MIAKAPPTRRRFAHEWDEIEYLYFKMLFWAYEKEDYRRASRFSDQLIKLLDRFDPKCEAILGASARALAADVNGRIDAAIRFRKREIKLLQRLLQIGGPAAEDLGPEDVSDRMDLLAIHYWDAGNLELARKTIEESRNYCRRHRIPFDGQDILDELSSEMPERNGSFRNPRRSNRKLMSK